MKKPTNQKLGLALGGGSALGFAHIGVLKALENNNIPIDFISGTSSGAIVGALYAFGIPIKTIEKEAGQITWRKLAKIRLSALGLTSNDIVREILTRQIGSNANIEDAKIPLAIVTTNIENGKRCVLKKGNVIDAVMASSCLPGLFSPIEINGTLLVDGGIVENVPITPLKTFGAKVTIGVNLLRHRRYTKPQSIIGVLVNSFDMINHRISAQPKQGDVDFLIEPDLSSYFMGDVEKFKEIAECGYQETLKYIADIKELQNQPSFKEILQKFIKIFIGKK